MAEEHVDKRNETQFPDERSRRRAHLDSGGTIANYDRSHYSKKNENKDPYDGGEDPNYAWTSESQDEMSQHYLKEKHKIPYMSENAQSIANSKLSRGGGANA